MIDFTFTEEQEILRANLRKFGEEEIAPRLAGMIEKKEIPQEVVKGLSAMGLLGMCISPRYGGLGLEAVTAGIVAEELGKADVGCAIPTFFLVQCAWSYILDKYGSEEVKREVFPEMRKGKAFVGVGVTEPDAGSDVASAKTMAVKKGSSYLLSGEKGYISGVREAEKDGGGFVTLVKTAPELKTRGMTLFFFPIKDVPGVTTRYTEELGREGISWGGFYMDNVSVPGHYRIGEENRGFYLVNEGFEFARGLIALVCVGAATKALENAINYMKQRQAFGRVIASYEGLQFVLAEDYSKLEAARLLAYKALWMYQKEQKGGEFSRFQVSKAVAMAKMLAPLWAFDAANHAMQWEGAYGYSMDCPEQRALRGIRSYTLAEGSTEVMRLIVTRELLGKEYIGYR
jgi:acyl-CoA dehydrogenase